MSPIECCPIARIAIQHERIAAGRIGRKNIATQIMVSFQHQGIISTEKTNITFDLPPCLINDRRIGDIDGHPAGPRHPIRAGRDIIT